MKTILLTIYICVFTLITNAQTETITGIVTNDTNPISGVQVISTSGNTITDTSGKFTLVLNTKNELLTFVHTSHKTSSKKASKKMIVVLEPKANNLDLVVVSASRTAQRRKEIPVAITAISAKTIATINPSSVDQVLNQQSGVHMVDLGNEQHMMSIRQPITTKGVYLYLEDGIPIRPTGVFNHNALLEMNMEATKTIEVIRGPYSALYGSEAVGGAINFITENPTPSLTGQFGVRMDDKGYFRTDAKISTTYKKTGIVVSGYNSKISNGIREYGNYNKNAITSKITHQFSNKLNWSNTLTFVDYFSEMSGGLDETKFNNRDYSSYHTFTFRDAKSLRVNSSLSQKWNTKNNTCLSFVYRDNTMKQNPSYRIADDTPFESTTTGELNDNSFNSYAVYLQHNISFDKLKTNISLGGNIDFSPKTFNAEILDVNRNSLGYFDSFKKTGVYKSDYSADILNTGTFITGNFEPITNLKVNAGLRYDMYSYDFKNRLDSASDYSSADAKEIFTAITPRIGLTYNFTKNIGAYANYSVGFIPPSISDLFRKDDVPLLDPTTFNNYELGGWISLFKNKVYIDFAVYSLYGKNEVASVSTKINGITTRENKNIGKTKHQGVEFGIKTTPIKSLTIRYNTAFSEHEYTDFVTKTIDGVISENNDYSGNKMPGAPKWISNSGIDYNTPFLKGFRIGAEWQHVSEYFTDELNKNTYEGYDTFNTRLGYDTAHFGIWMNVMNLTNELYATRANTAWGKTTYTPGNPKTIVIGLKYKL